MGFAKRVGLRESAVRALGRLLERGAEGPLDLEAQASDLQEVRTGMGKLDQADLEVRGLVLLVNAAGEGHYVPFVYLGNPVGKGFRNVALVRQRHRPIRWKGYLRSWAAGQYRVSQDFYLSQGHASHLYLRPPPGTALGRCALPGHWPKDAVDSNPHGSVWSVYVRQSAKREIAAAKAKAGAERGSPAWNAQASFLLPPTPRVLLGFVFLLLSVGSLWLGTRGDAAITQKLLSLDALAGSITLPILWAYRENDIAILHVGGRAIVLGIIAGVWLAISSEAGVAPVAAGIAMAVGLAMSALDFALALQAARESHK